MKELISKQFEGHQIRTTIDEKGGIWFVAKDACEALEIKHQFNALKKLKAHQRSITNVSTLGGNQEVQTISESGLYRICFISKKANAEAFQSWVTEDLLPTLRKTGKYLMRQLTPCEQLLENAQRLVDHERAIANVTKEVIHINNTMNKVEAKIDHTNNKVNNLLMNRRGEDPVPEGTIALEKIVQKYFFGVSPPVVSQYLRAIKHPVIDYTYLKDGIKYSSLCFKQAGLLEASDNFFSKAKVIKITPKNIQFEHQGLIENFRIKKSDITARHKTMFELDEMN